ncbi:hypothetical protein V8J88_09360 [Massilia sp. W12]|uniref:hypothetical protein n=1 Tax=Massilia sp. W12 TaxID=3126507 RepID=UPI0030D05616
MKVFPVLACVFLLSPALPCGVALASPQASQALESLAAVTPLSEANTQLAERLSALMREIGDAVQQKQHVAAKEKLEQARGLLSQLQQADPGHAQSLHLHAWLQVYQGDLAEGRAAYAAYRRALTLFEQLTASAPRNLGWQLEMAELLRRIAFVQHEYGDSAGAWLSARRAYDQYQMLMKTAPNEITLQQGRITILNLLGDIKLAQSELAAALTYFLLSVQGYEAILARQPSDIKMRIALGLILSHVGQIQAAQQQDAQARATFQREINLHAALLELPDLSQAQLQSQRRQQAEAMERMSTLQWDSGEKEAAFTLLRSSLALRLRFAEIEATPAALSALAMAHGNLARVAAALSQNGPQAPERLRISREQAQLALQLLQNLPAREQAAQAALMAEMQQLSQAP